jgi:hypothetical protein
MNDNNNTTFAVIAIVSVLALFEAVIVTIASSNNRYDR